ncbi:MAG: hypothetical protein LBK41_06215 [Clostridiales bacterium]|nr:hypothetical protein [Clostridiales bacterium]
MMKISSGGTQDSIDPVRFECMKTGLARIGVGVVSDKESDRYLSFMGAEAMTLSDGSAIIIQSGKVPTA